MKFELYRRFTNALAVSVVASVGWIFYEMWFKVTDMINEKWEGDWVTRAFWEALSFGITAAICWLWRPVEAWILPWVGVPALAEPLVLTEISGLL